MAPRVVFVTGRDPTVGKGGGSTYVRAHARAAQLAGFEAHVFCLAAKPAESGIATTDFAVVHRVASSTPFDRWLGDSQTPEHTVAHWFNALAHSAYMVPFHGRRLAAAIAEFLRDATGPQLVHGFYTWGWVGVNLRHHLRGQLEVIPLTSCFTLAAEEVGAKVRGARQTATERWLFRGELLWIKCVVERYERRTYSDSRRVLVNYDSVGNMLRRRYGAGIALQKLPYSSDEAFSDGRVPRRERRGTADEPVPCIVALSRHDPRKGLHILLQALALLRARRVPFRATLLSGGPLLGMHRRMAETLGLGDSVTFPGWVADPGCYLAQSDIFVLPSLQEGSGSLALLEALQAAMPIVASRIDGVAEDITDGLSGLLVPPEDPAALSGALERLLRDPALRLQLGRRARACFEERFSAGRFVEALGTVYRDAVSAS
jgi:glycosyltransferase involved in cell wall biosynthesis